MLFEALFFDPYDMMLARYLHYYAKIYGLVAFD